MNRSNPFACLGLSLLLAGTSLVSAQTPGATTRPKIISNKTIKQWTLKGPLGTTPQRTREDLPLTDQENKAKWVKFDPMWDEFDGAALDTNKWATGLQNWRGRKPAWYNPTNVTVRDGQLHLAMRKETVPKEM